MKNNACGFYRTGNRVTIHHVAGNDFEMILVRRLIQPSPGSISAIVDEGADLCTRFDKCLHQMTSNETSGAGHEDALSFHRSHYRPAAMRL